MNNKEKNTKIDDNLMTTTKSTILNDNSPARIIPRNHRTTTGFVHGNNNGMYSGFESSLERDALILIAFNPSIVSYLSQPRTFNYFHDNKRRKYTPDIFIEYSNGKKVYIEVKYREDIQKDWNILKPKFKAAIEHLSAEKDTRFKIWTEKEIRTPLLKNATFLLPYKHRSFENYQLEMIKKVVSRFSETNPEDVINICSSNLEARAEFLNTLWYALSNQIVNADLTRPLTMKSSIWI
ncbi:TnsA endonuclease N-terminal domain-containing protein [Psychrobacter alimentarius]|uniref:TnsA endonuclease N-terminal domain-containing protein n=1 Tax=Psychrobacter alimentarius TaxID=261164 RepID=UPI003C7F6C54